MVRGEPPTPAEPGTDSSNPFVLPGLPSFPGLRPPTRADRKKAGGAKKRRRRPVEIREDEEPWDSEAFADDWNHFTPPPVLPPVDDSDSEYTGAWDDWVTDPEHRAPESEAPEIDLDLDPSDEVDDDSEWDLPGYDAAAADYADNGTAARAAFKDRSGGRGVLRAAAGREHGAGSGRSGARAVKIVAVLLVWAVVLAVVVVLVITSTTDQKSAASSATSAPPAASVTSSAPRAWEHATPGCTATRTVGTAVGAEPGSTASAIDAIFGFEWAFYVDRSATKVRSYTTDDAKVPPAQVIQSEAIDQVPVGTRYCVYVTQADESGNLWNVEVHEHWPGEPTPTRWGQTITTVQMGDRTLITAVAER
ncbi:hypothetical protein ACFVMC_32895 [Nocardia sp. NPDC127579]|uniref:hypothetical protein n=1 Tax=Nocardia sp. NPDC127579 TaxID=3345402 RepID=UPI003631444C